MDNKTCKICGYLMTLKPAGISKKPPFKPYNAFWTCSSGDRTHTENIEAPQVPPAQPMGVMPPVTMPQPQAPRPMVAPTPEVQNAMRVEEEKQLRIARESCLSSASKVISSFVSSAKELYTTPEITDMVIEMAEVFSQYVYNGLPVKTESVSDAEMESIANSFK